MQRPPTTTDSERKKRMREIVCNGQRSLLTSPRLQAQTPAIEASARGFSAPPSRNLRSAITARAQSKTDETAQYQARAPWPACSVNTARLTNCAMMLTMLNADSAAGRRQFEWAAIASNQDTRALVDFERFGVLFGVRAICPDDDRKQANCDPESRLDRLSAHEF